MPYHRSMYLPQMQDCACHYQMTIDKRQDLSTSLSTLLSTGHTHKRNEMKN